MTPSYFRLSAVALVAALAGCSGASPPNEPGNAGGAGVPAASQGGAASGAAGAGPSNTGGMAPSNTAGANMATSGAPVGGASGAGTLGGASNGGVGGSRAGNGGLGESGGAAGAIGGSHVGGGGNGAGGQVDPALLPETTLHLAGDSTVMTYEANSAQEGWGQELPQFLLGKVKLDNQAIGGASVETFYAGRWKNIMSALQAGDYVMAAFGANDSGTVEGRHVDPPAFSARFDSMAQEVSAKKATFIIVTPSALQEWSGGKNGNQRLGPYVSALLTLGGAKGLEVADLNARSLAFLNEIGQEAAKEIYIDGDKAHFTKKGATKMAELVARELTRIGSPLGAYVK